MHYGIHKLRLFCAFTGAQVDDSSSSTHVTKYLLHSPHPQL